MLVSGEDAVAPTVEPNDASVDAVTIAVLRRRLLEANSTISEQQGELSSLRRSQDLLVE